ncbi:MULTISPECIES: histone deacetylase [unclassified Kitasatospora]|uniref:histone deacetylase n=1 Tax=unclassified Kitasatospora TaxID=2633591 RepID=UPI0024758F05|nr:histone deacetylase [Kitasatospora sp. MAP12-44]
MHLERLTCYLAGGRPPGGAHVNPGCRDPRPPRRNVPIVLPGRLYFALESRVWTGGMAFYDPYADDQTPARAYLLTVGQLSDLAAQEMRRPTGQDLDLGAVLATGRDEFGPGRYETLIRTGTLDGLPVLTLTAPDHRADVPLNPPAARYLRQIAAGLADAHGWHPERSAAYLATRPGAAGSWTPSTVLAALADGDRPEARRPSA